MVTDLPERGVEPLLRVAVKVTGWLTVGVAVDAWSVAVVLALPLLTTLMLTTGLVDELIRAVAGEGGVVGALAGRTEGLGEGDLTGGIGRLCGVGVADVVDVVVDGDRLA